MKADEKDDDEKGRVGVPGKRLFMGMVFLSLAYLGRTEIAESLSKVAITEIIGVVLIYCLKSLFENLSMNNTWPDKTEKEPVNTKIDSD